jgi:ABC-2 type transport system permease protein
MAAAQLLLPLFSCVVVGDMVSSETADGTLRSILARPVGRTKLLCAKYSVSVLYTLALTLFLGIVAYIIGAIFLGRGALPVILESINFSPPAYYQYSEMEGIGRLATFYAFTALGMLSVATISFFISSFVGNSLGAIGGAMMTLIIFHIIGAIPYFEYIRPYLFTTHITAGTAFLANPVPWDELQKAILTLSTYIVVFFGLGLLVFKRKDVLS